MEQADLEPTIRVITVFTSDLASLPEGMKSEVGDTAMHENKGEVAQMFDLRGRPSVVGTTHVTQFVEDVKEQLASGDPTATE